MSSYNSSLDDIKVAEKSPIISVSANSKTDTSLKVTGVNLSCETLSQSKSGSNRWSVFVAGIALFSVGYNAQIIGYMAPLFSDLYPNDMSSSIKTRLSNSYLIGEVFGTLFFGLTIDRLGRRSGTVIATLFLILGITLATSSYGKDRLGMFWMMILARGVAGFGAGGEYPSSGTGAAEASDGTDQVRKRRGILVALATDFSVSLGFVGAGFVSLIVIACYQQKPTDGVWRICFGIGVILPLINLVFRIRMADSKQYQKYAMKSKVPYFHALKLYWKPMLGTSLAWFCYDFVAYPFAIFSSTIVSQLHPGNTLTQDIGYGTVICFFYVPGCIIGGFLMDRIGRKQTMTLGFILWGVVGFILGAALEPIQRSFPLFVVIYGLFNALGEMGPGVATFLCAAESFPTPLRGHYMGFAAAVGKAGAAIGTQTFAPIQDSFSRTVKGQQAVFLVGSAISIIGGIVSWFLIPDKEKDLDSEDIRFMAYLEDEGYDTSCYGVREAIGDGTKTE